MTRDLVWDHCLVMGIVNRTPDSFYDGGRMELDAAVAHGVTLVEKGADILDVGAVKAGPGNDVSESEEVDRLLPLVEALARETDVALSIETGRPEVARLAFDAGASILNDVSGFADPELARVCGTAGAYSVLMHNGGQIRGRPRNPRYVDVVTSVIAEWNRLAALARAAGVPEERILVDPGLDFGKNTFHSLELMRRLPELTAAGRPVLIAPSHKDVVGETLGLPIDQRLEGTLALIALSVIYGARIVRVHDVKATVRTARMVEAVIGSRRPVAPIRGLWE